jgi:OmpA-OmpF porin, OOP family
MHLELEVMPVERPAHFDGMCETLFANTLRDGNLTFSPSSSEISTGSLSLLDELVEISTDCPSLSILVSGHADDSADTTTLAELSRARAESVVRYLIGHGIRAARLSVAAAAPAASSTGNGASPGRHGRRQIEFALRFE